VKLDPVYGSRQIAVSAAAGSFLLLAGALYFQYFRDLAPCPMCIWQRWPHGIAIALGALALFAPIRPVALLGALVMAVSTGLGIYHTGVEQKWWRGPDTCVAPDISGLSSEDLLARILEAPVVRCDEIAWTFLGLSMPAWNAVFSLVLVGFWLRAYASSSASQ
jgi:disulfide bond formation protein DsbB